MGACVTQRSATRLRLSRVTVRCRANCLLLGALRFGRWIKEPARTCTHHRRTDIVQWKRIEVCRFGLLLIHRPQSESLGVLRALATDSTRGCQSNEKKSSKDDLRRATVHNAPVQKGWLHPILGTVSIDAPWRLDGFARANRCENDFPVKHLDCTQCSNNSGFNSQSHGIM